MRKEDVALGGGLVMMGIVVGLLGLVTASGGPATC